MAGKAALLLLHMPPQRHCLLLPLLAAPQAASTAPGGAGSAPSTHRPQLHTAASRPRRNSPSQVVTCEAAGRVRGARNPRGDSVPAAPWVSGGRPTRPRRRRRRRLSRPYLPVTAGGRRAALPRYATKKGASVPPCVAGAPYAWLGASPTRLSRGWAIAAAGSAAVAGSRARPRSSSRSAGAGRGGPRGSRPGPAEPTGGKSPMLLRRDRDAPRQL
eukprot:SAG25_NODE_209_length_11844_cov_3.436782_8_plen_216_part_00